MERPRLLAWLDDPSEERGPSFAQDDGSWTFVSFAGLARASCAAAAQIAACAAGSGPVAIILPTGPGFIGAFFGSVLSGHTPCPLPPPGFLEDVGEYRRHIERIFRVARPAAIVTDAHLAPLASQAARDAAPKAPILAFDGNEEPGDLPDRPRPPLALLQFTSGSTGDPRGARITWDALETNMAMILRWLELRPGDRFASWLPPFHDMGLVGGVLGSLVVGSETLYLRPEQFVRDPARWLACFGRMGATMGAAPGFAFAYASKRVPSEALAGMDFSNWRIAIVGGERVDPGALTQFKRLLAPHGFRTETFVPAYGLAEATLSVTGVPVDAVARMVRLDWAELRLGHPVPIEAEAAIGDELIGDGVGWLVECGPPHSCVKASVVDREGRSLPSGRLGEIVVEGPSVADGYLGADEIGSTRFTGHNRLRTGDAGFVLNDSVFIVGRIADSFSVRGRNVYAEDLEARLGALDGLAKGRCVVLSAPAREGEGVVLLAEAEPGGWIAEAARLLTGVVGDALPVKLLYAPLGTIQRTSSGKPRRRAMWAALLEGSLTAQLAWSRDADANRPATGP